LTTHTTMEITYHHAACLQKRILRSGLTQN
jgi:hypothetical protein